MTPPRVFLSHAPADTKQARRAGRTLDRMGLSWESAAGRTGFPAGSTLVVLWSRHSAAAENVESHWRAALECGVEIVLVPLDDTPREGPPASFPSMPWPLFEAQLPSLLAASAPPEDAVHEAPTLIDHPAAPEAETIHEAETIAGAAQTPPPPAEPAPQGEAGDGALPFIGERYRMIRLLGKGGMGAVYQAYDQELDRDVAVKIIRPDLAGNTSVLQRFKREIQLSSTVTHRNVLRVYDLGEYDGIKFLTMQYVEGETLSALVRREGKLPRERFLHIFRQICKGLAAAHERDILHRDLKPSNVMIDAEDNVYLTDFGLARSITHSDLTQTGEVMGTPDYMSPEQVKGEKVDARSDIYSMGVILYEMVTGQVPYTGDTIYEIMMQRVQKPPRPAAEVNTDTPAYLDSIIRRCMAIETPARYASITELLADLDQGMDTGHTMVGTRFFMRNWRERLRLYPWGRAAVMAGLVVVLAGGGWWLWQRGRATSQPAAPQEPVSVLVADFRNLTGDELFTGALEQTMDTALEGASFVTTFNRGRARNIGKQLDRDAAGLDADLARLVAAREGINIIVDGSISAGSRGYDLSVRALDAITGDTVFTDSGRAPAREDVLGALAGLAAGIRQKLGDTVPESAQLAAAETFTAGSLAAARSYALAQEMQGTGQWEKAITLYNEAIREDQDMGRAYAGLAVMYRNLGKRGEAEKHYKLAMARIDRMTERERFRTRGGYFVTVGNHEKAEEEYRTLVEQYPADFVGYSNLALARFLSRDMGQALEDGRRASDIYPKNVVMRSNLSLYAMYAGDFDLAAAEARGVLESEKSYGAVYVCLALAELARGNAERAAEAYGTMQGLGAADASTAAVGLADLAYYEGRLADAVAILREGIEADTGAGSAYAAARKSAALGFALFELGQTSKAGAAAARAAAGSRQAPVLLEAARLYTAAGRADAALALAKELASRIETESQVYARLIESEVELQKGNAWDAIGLLVEARKMADTWIGRFILGRAYLEASAFTEAYAEFEQCLKRQGEAAALFLDDIPTLRYLPPVHYYLGRTQQGLGSPAAAESYKRFLAIKEKGGQGLLVADARRRLGSK